MCLNMEENLKKIHQNSHNTMHLEGTRTIALLQFLYSLRRVDKLSVAPGWDRLKEISAEEGLIAIGYERKQGQYR